jgi:hypothetical membrane protein
MTMTLTAAGNRTSHLRLAAIAAGPLFVVSALAQMASRDGFDLMRHPISQLSTGDHGWIQITTFVLTGLGVLALAVELKRTITTGLGRRVVPIFVGLFGAGLVAAGLFVTDPENGFPVGAPQGPAAQVSWHSIAHGTAAAVAFTALAVACVVLTIRAVRERAVLPALLHGAVAVILLLPMSPAYVSVQLALTGLVAFTWTTAVAVTLRVR